MKKVHIVTYTHWDREFRWEFERTRMRLVDLFDHLFEIMEEKPDYRSFLCDGQLTLIADYLEIRPEMTDTVLIRVYNPTEKEIKGKITLGFNAKSARSIRLDGKVNEELELKDNIVSVKVGKGKIYTVEVL